MFVHTCWESRVKGWQGSSAGGRFLPARDVASRCVPAQRVSRPQLWAWGLRMQVQHKGAWAPLSADVGLQGDIAPKLIGPGHLPEPVTVENVLGGRGQIR